MNPRRSHTRQRYSLPLTGCPLGAKPLGHVRARLVRRNAVNRQRVRELLRERCRILHPEQVPAFVLALGRKLFAEDQRKGKVA